MRISLPWLLGAALAAAVLLWRAPTLVNDASKIQNWKHWNCALLGEALIHGIPSRIPTRMPLWNILDAWFLNHGGLFLWQLLPVLELVLVFMVARTTGDPFFLAAAGAMALLSVFDRAAAYRSWEGPFNLFPLVTAILMAWKAASPTLPRTFLLSLSLGFSFLYRSPMAFLPLVLALYDRFFTFGRSNPHWKKHVALLCSVPYLFVLPWLKMNYILLNRFIPFEQEDILWLGSALGHVHLVNEDLRSWALNATSQYAPAWALQRMLSQPFEMLTAVGQRLFWILSFHPYLFLFAALAVAVRIDRPAIRSLGLLTAYLIAIQCLVPIDPRYLNPIWPLLCLLITTGIFSRPANCDPVIKMSRLDKSMLVLGIICCMPAFYVLYRVKIYTDVMRRPLEKPARLESVIRLWPSDAWLYYERGMESLKGNRLKKAAEDLRRACVLNPQNYSYRMAWVSAEMFRGRLHPLLGLTRGRNDADEIIIRMLTAYAHARRLKKHLARKEACSAFMIHKIGLERGRIHLNPAPTRGERSLYEWLDRNLYRNFIDEQGSLWDFRPIEERDAVMSLLLRHKC